MSKDSMYDSLSWSCRLLRALFREGVRHIYISPGSRSTPLVLAAVTHPGFDTRSVLDERSAAYQALGAAKASGLPAVMICTSGTALANTHPAMVEAREAGVPFILLSADRPPHLRGTGSSQTIDQIKLFGDTPLMFHELGEPAGHPEDLARLDLLARQAVHTAVEQGGPVHLNAPFRKPLEPTPDTLEKETRINRSEATEFDNSSRNRFKTLRSTRLFEPLPADILHLFQTSERPLLIAGPEEYSRSLPGLSDYLQQKLRLPVIAEPGSHPGPETDSVRRYDMILRDTDLLETLTPDLLIKIGDRPYSKAVHDFETANPDLPVIQFLQRDTWQQGSGRADCRIVLRGRLPDLETQSPSTQSWSESWRQADEHAETLLTDLLDSDGPLTDLHVVHQLTDQLGPDWNLMVSNSFTIRDLALAGTPGPCPAIFTNRGAAGIDGILSTGIGLTHSSGRPITILAGDLAFLHDSNALLSLRNCSVSVRIVIINNGGGTIFRMLPVRKAAPDHYTTWFETPQQVDIQSLARAHGIPYRMADSIQSLNSHLKREPELTDTTIIECRTDPDATMRLRETLWNGGERDDFDSGFTPPVRSRPDTNVEDRGNRPDSNDSAPNRYSP